MKNQPNQTGRAVLVTTQFRGVFFGYVVDESKLPNEITLARARNAISWAASVGGFLGLASTGVNSECKIGSCVEDEELRLFSITSVTGVTEAAAKTWESA
ncbi:MAG TPA: hypothetical protein VGD05_06260 [Pyrinomonadaceae bacterium]|jgi:hypothetical protein